MREQRAPAPRSSPEGELRRTPPSPTLFPASPDEGNVDDAWGTVNRGYLAPGFGFAATSIGPELGFGHAITRDGEPALLLKVAWGGTSLATDWRPPRSAAAPTPFCPDCTEVGWCYGNMTRYVHAALANLSAVFPGYDASRGYELVGWAWHQGWNDGCGYNQSYEYEYNLANLIRDLDDEFAAETRGEPLKVAIAVQGTSGGWDGQPDRRLEVLRAQYNVSQHAEFAGRVAAVETRGFWRDFNETSSGPCGQDYHWNCNAASYFFIGTAAGQAMAALADGTWAQPFINATNDHGAPPASRARDVEDACSVR